MRNISLRTLTYALLVSLAFLSCQSTVNRSTPKPEVFTFVKQLGLGYNLGNTLEACGGTKGNKISNFEVAWGAPMTTKAIFEDLKARGFNTIRIPVAWSNLIADDHTIHPDLMNRVEEVAVMVMDSGMHAIVNIHWDGGWFADFPKDYAGSMKKYKRIWSQISERFKKYDERLIFESLNEEGCFDDVWNRYSGGGTGTKKKAFDILNSMNQAFVDLVRASGGYNASRYLLIAGYATDFVLSASDEFLMPRDSAGRCIISLHYYTPANFTIIDKDASWAKSAYSWGDSSDVRRLKDDFDSVKTDFLDKGIPVILGEFGSATNNKDPESVRKYLTEVAHAAWALGICPILWGGALDHYDRRELRFADPLLGEMFLELSKTPR
jgi:endoglucanase